MPATGAYEQPKAPCRWYERSIGKPCSLRTREMRLSSIVVWIDGRLNCRCGLGLRPKSAYPVVHTIPKTDIVSVPAGILAGRQLLLRADLRPPPGSTGGPVAGTKASGSSKSAGSD